MRLLVTGGRDFDDAEMITAVLDTLHAQHGFIVLIHGNASGVDRLCGQWAANSGVAVQACPADWKRYGRGAGPIRNRQLLDEQPDLLVAFPGGKGTADMVKVATKAGLTVVMAIDVVTE